MTDESGPHLILCLPPAKSIRLDPHQSRRLVRWPGRSRDFEAQEWGITVLTPLIMKLEHFLPLPDQDKGWLNSLVLSYDDFPRGIRDQREHAKIIEVSMTEDDPSLTVSCR